MQLIVKKAKYVLELNSGVFKSLYLNLGDKILLKNEKIV